MTRQRLDSLMLLFAEQQIANDINYDEIIKELKVMTRSKRRLEL